MQLQGARKTGGSPVSFFTWNRMCTLHAIKSTRLLAGGIRKRPQRLGKCE
jgi:hypothetical protein